MQDGSPGHRSKIVNDFLKKKKIKTFDWPGNSPDLKPDRKLVDFLMDKVTDRRRRCEKALEKAIKGVWLSGQRIL